MSPRRATPSRAAVAGQVASVLGLIAILAAACSGLASEPPVESGATPTSSTSSSSTETDQPTAPAPSTVAEGPRRTYALGFTPFPHEISTEAVDAAYENIATNADLYAFHSTEGVPWPEAAIDTGLDGYGSNLQDKWRRHRAEMDANPEHKVYLALTPLDDSRSGLADYWGSAEHQARPEEFLGASFDAPQVVDAYTNYVLTAVDWYRPDYLAIGVEANLLAKHDPGSWPALMALLRHTYTTVKTEHPELPVFVTVTAIDILDGWADVDHEAQSAALDEILEISDYFALSFYPYTSAYLTGPLPDGTFDQLAILAAGRPIAIAETGYPAQRTELPTYSLTFEGTPVKQQRWIETVLQAAEEYRMPFVVNFVGRDYDALWESIGATDLAAVWRDTGLFDEAGAPRPALDTWLRHLAVPRE